VQRRRIGSLEVTVVGLGTNSFGFYLTPDEVRPVVDAALEHGINFFDTADVYRDAEEKLARALGRRRADVVLATKFGNRRVDGKWGACGSPEYVRQCLDASLKRLSTDWIDLYQLHAPDPDTPIADTVGALAEAVTAGKVREIGCSNVTAAQLAEADAAAGSGPRFVAVQNRYNLLERVDEAGVLPACARLGLAYLPYYPLANGLLTGKYARGEDPAEGTRLHRMGAKGTALLSGAAHDRLEALTSWAAQRGHTLLDLAIAWLAANPVVGSVIAGATKPGQVIANAAAGGWQLSPAEAVEVTAIATHGQA
jgi:aryl-alcohol dehydrogenase-like predicted oxidoreductase